MTTKTLTRSFSAGEISPSLYGREDMAAYVNGLKTSFNYLPLSQGPIQRRPGSRFQQFGLGDLDYTRLVPFVYSDDQAYLIEFSNGKLRIHTDSGTLLDTTKQRTIHSITRDTVGLVRVAAGLITTGSLVYITCAGMTQLSGRWYLFTFVRTEGGRDVFKLSTPASPTAFINTTDFGAFTSGTTDQPIELTTPYSGAAAIDNLTFRFVQSADVLTVVSENHPVYTLRRTGPNTWTFTAPSFGPQIAAPTSLTATSEGGGGGTPTTEFYVVTYVVTDGSSDAESLAYATPASASNDLSIAGHYNQLTTGSPPTGQRANFYKALNGLYGFIGQGNNSFQDNRVIPDLATAPPQFGEDFNATGDYPRAVTYFEQRKVFGGPINHPQTVYMTRTGTEVDTTFSIPSRDNDSIEFGIYARELQTIQHFVPLAKLLILTAGGVWTVNSGSDQPIAPNNVAAAPASYRGSSFVQPAVSDNNVLYAFGRGSRVGEIKYDFSVNGFVPNDVCLLAPHLFDGYGITCMAMMETPSRVLWVVRSDGQLLAMTYEPNQKVTAWSRHDVGGDVISCAVLPAGVDNLGGQNPASEDALYIAVRRTNPVTSAEYVTLECITGFTDYPDGTALHANNMRFADQNSQLVSGSPVTVIDGLFYLEGHVVSPLTDGGVHPARTVVNGRITLENGANRVVIGTNFLSRAEGLPLRVRGDDEAAGMGRLKNIDRMYIRQYQSGAHFAGPKPDDGTAIWMVEQRTRSTEPYGSPPTLDSGESEMVMFPEWNRDGSWCIEQRYPLPSKILAIAFDVEFEK